MMKVDVSGYEVSVLKAFQKVVAWQRRL